MPEVGGDAKFNQAAFQQARLHELFREVDKLSVDLFSIDMNTGNYGYESVYNYLNSILATVSPKLAKKELEFLFKFKIFIRDFIELNPIWRLGDDVSFDGSRPVRLPDTRNRNKIDDHLFEYRVAIEYYMDLHGLSNPNKEAEAGWD